MSTTARPQRILRSLLVLPFVIGLCSMRTAAAATTYDGTGGDFNVAYFDDSGNPVTGTTTFAIPVIDVGLVSPGDSVTVTLTGLEYPYAADLEVSLSLYNPSNDLLARGDLFNQIGIVNPGDPGYGPQFLGNYSFDSSFTGDLWSTAFPLGSSDNILSGPYWPTTAGSPNNDNLSSLFGGLPVNGTWVLTVNDYYPPFGGGPEYYAPGIVSWSLTVQTSPLSVPDSPTAVAVPLFLSLLLAIRRRNRACCRYPTMSANE